MRLTNNNCLTTATTTRKVETTTQQLLQTTTTTTRATKFNKKRKTLTKPTTTTTINQSIKSCKNSWKTSNTTSTAESLTALAVGNVQPANATTTTIVATELLNTRIPTIAQATLATTSTSTTSSSSAASASASLTSSCQSCNSKDMSLWWHRRQYRWHSLTATLILFFLSTIIQSPALNVQGFKSDIYKNLRLGHRIVQTRYGRLHGLILPLDNYRFLRSVEVFLGVPYATPPTKQNRFSPTRAPAPWDGIRISDTYSPVCPQRLPNIQNETAALEKMPKGRLEYLKRLLPHLENQSEDCLYLNIFSPINAFAYIILPDDVIKF